LRNEKPLAGVGMLYSERTQRFYGGEKHQQNQGDHELGMYHALVEARVPFEMIHDEYLDIDRIGHFRLLVLPNIAAMSDRQCRQIREYVKRGGSLLATYETSLYNERGEKREDFGLADIFGVSFNGQVEGPMLNSYLRLSVEDEAPHPILEGLTDTTRIINGIYRLGVKADVDFPSPLTLIPSYPDVPMEHVYPRMPVTNIREVYLRQLGGSRVIYFPWDIDRTFWEILDTDHGKLIRNAVNWATGKQQPAYVEGKGIVDIAAWMQGDSMTVHIVNLTNPMMLKGPFRELIPLPPQVVRIRIPDKRKVARVQMLVAGEEPGYVMNGDSVELTASNILDHEVIALDLE
jgi:hypothetical protein